MSVKSTVLLSLHVLAKTLSHYMYIFLVVLINCTEASQTTTTFELDLMQPNCVL